MSRIKVLGIFLSSASIISVYSALSVVVSETLDFATLVEAVLVTVVEWATWTLPSFAYRRVFPMASK